jgi:hypothetical protein
MSAPKPGKTRVPAGARESARHTADEMRLKAPKLLR